MNAQGYIKGLMLFYLLFLLFYLCFFLPSFLEAVLEAVRQKNDYVFFLNHNYKTEIVFFPYDRFTAPDYYLSFLPDIIFLSIQYCFTR